MYTLVKLRAWEKRESISVKGNNPICILKPFASFTPIYISTNLSTNRTYLSIYKCWGWIRRCHGVGSRWGDWCCEYLRQCPLSWFPKTGWNVTCVKEAPRSWAGELREWMSEGDEGELDGAFIRCQFSTGLNFTPGLERHKVGGIFYFFVVVLLILLRLTVILYAYRVQVQKLLEYCGKNTAFQPIIITEWMQNR